MLVTFTFVFFCIFPLHEGKLIEVAQTNNENLKECIGNIVKTYFSKYSTLTYLDIDYDGDDIYKAVHSLATINILQRDELLRMTAKDESYLIVCANVSIIDYVFGVLKKDTSWNPNAQFLIVVHNLIDNDIELIFDILLKSRILDVLLMNAEHDPDLYTYNPYENFNCGRRYDRIIEYGKCSASRNTNLYPYKLVTGLKNCTIRVKTPHWPPYSIHPLMTNNSDIGIEEFVLRQMSIKYNFFPEFKYSNDAEIFTMITANLLAVGPLKLLQNNEIDAVLGGMILTQARAKAFNYIHGHLPFTEEIRCLVRRSQPVSIWKYLYTEFQLLVWVILLLAFIVFFLFFVFLVKTKDKSRIVLVMFGYLVLNAVRIKGNHFTKYFFTLWILCSYLISAYYVSILVSLTTHPLMNYQISTVEDIKKYNLKPCVSVLLRSYIRSEESILLGENTQKNCITIMNSIKSVSTSVELFTFVLYSIYLYKAKKFYDKNGNNMLYTLPQPVNRIEYAIYFYKGFPMLKNLTIIARRMRETGLIDYALNNLHWKVHKVYHISQPEEKATILIPYRILILGYVISAGCFLTEVLITKSSRKKLKLPF